MLITAGALDSALDRVKAVRDICLSIRDHRSNLIRPKCRKILSPSSCDDFEGRGELVNGRCFGVPRRALSAASLCETDDEGEKAREAGGTDGLRATWCWEEEPAAAEEPRASIAALTLMVRSSRRFKTCLCDSMYETGAGA